MMISTNGMKVYIKWHRAIQDAKHRPMRNCSEQVLNSYKKS